MIDRMPVAFSFLLKMAVRRLITANRTPKISAEFAVTNAMNDAIPVL